MKEFVENLKQRIHIVMMIISLEEDNFGENLEELIFK